MLTSKGLTADEVKAFLSQSASFFKHAGKDPDEVLKFQPELNEHFMLDAVDLYEKLTDEIVEEFVCLRFAIAIRNPLLANLVAMSAEQKEAWTKTAETLRKENVKASALLPQVRRLAREYVRKKEPVL